MKLYYSTATCATACRIAFEELGLGYEPVEVSWQKDLNVGELDKVNPLGAVPVLVNDQGKILTQNVAILEYLADLKPTAKLLAAQGSWERTETLSWLAFVASDFQRSFEPFFTSKEMTQSSTAQTEIKAFTKKKIESFLPYIDQSLVGKSFLTGNQFTVADIYLFTVLGWTQWLEVSTKEFKNITAYMKRIFDRPAVYKILAEEDLLDYLQ